MEELRKLKDVVHEVMTQDPKTRNSDKWLIIQVLRKLGFKIYVDYKDLKNMPSFESITRVRRDIQNKDFELLPTKDTGDNLDYLEKCYKEVFGNGKK